jgi:hypothetical protein
MDSDACTPHFVKLGDVVPAGLGWAGLRRPAKVRVTGSRVPSRLGLATIQPSPDEFSHACLQPTLRVSSALPDEGAGSGVGALRQVQG